MGISFNKFGFEPVDLDSELFLTEVPLDLLEETITSQFDDPLDSKRTDYIQSFITKYDFSKENGHEDDQFVYDTIYDEFIEFITDLFEDRLDVVFPSIDGMRDDDALELLQLTYRFFIRNMKKNFVTLIKNFIDRNKPTVVSNLEQKKDVTSITFREELDDEDDILILSNLGLVIKDLLGFVVNNFTTNEFFEYCVGKSMCLETAFVMSKYESFAITGNFIEKYVDMVDESFQYDIESSIRNHILKKYGNKRKGIPIVPDSDKHSDDSLDEDDK